jgi:hypothetical protein
MAGVGMVVTDSGKRFFLALTVIIATIALASLGFFLNLVSTLCLSDEARATGSCSKTPGLSFVYFYLAAFGPAVVVAAIGVFSVIQRRTRLLAITIMLMVITDIVLPDVLWGELVCHNGCV